MRDVRKIGRRTWLARATGGAVAVWTSMRIGGRDGWAVSLGMPSTPITHAQGPDHAGHEGHPLADIRRIPLGQNGFTTSYVVIRGSEAAIVDTGVSGSADRIGEVVQEAGLTWDAVRHLIVTHHHGDHAGSVGAVLNAATGATIWAGAADIPSISSPREIQAAADGAEVFGLRVLATPGHTLGHISVYDEAVSTLITGDAISNVGGSLAGSSPQFTADMTQAVESIRKLAAMSVERALFMHGDPIESGAGAAIGRLAMALPNDTAMVARLLGDDPASGCCHA
jgi:glyoxylase-like metal-dependent hydrolase (beta-lactamase superfamily II)